MAATKSNTPKTKNKISDIASMFGGMAKMKKVRTPKRLKQKALDEEDDLLRQKMEALKHVEDSKKNRFANHLSSQNVFDFALRKSPRPHKDGNHRQPSPMPPISTLPNDIVTATTSTSTSASSSSSASSASSASESDDTHSPQHNKIKHRSHRNTKIQKHKHTNHNHIPPVQNGIDLNVMRAKLRPIGNHNNNEDTFGDDEEEEHMIDIEENRTPQSTANDVKHIPILNKERNASWSSNKSNDEDTEIDDISSTRSNSINEKEEEATKAIVITLNDGRDAYDLVKEKEERITTDPDYNEWLSASDVSASDDASSLSSSDSASSSTMSSGTDTDTDLDSEDNGSDGLHKHHRTISLKHRVKKRNFGGSISLDTSDGGSKRDIFLMDIQLFDENGDLTQKEPKKKQASKRSASAMAQKQWNYDELFGDNVQIGAIKTPKFDKETKEKKHSKRASSAMAHKEWNYDELFGDSVQIGAIKTPKFKKKEANIKRTKLQSNEPKERKRASSALMHKKWNYDELFGSDVQIGAIKTPKFNKTDYVEKKKKEEKAAPVRIRKRGGRKRSMTQSNRKEIKTRKRAVSAVAKRSWNYDELFGDSVQIGAIKTPKFHKESKATAIKKAQEAKPKPSAINTEHAAAFDLSDILGDSFSFNKMNRKCDAIPESSLDGDLEEDSYCFDTHYSTDEEDSADTNTYDDDYYATMMGDVTPVTPNMPELPPLNAHNLSIDSQRGTAMTASRSSVAKAPAVAMIEEESEEEEEAEAESESHLDKLMQIFDDESSDEEFEPPQPAKSAFEIEREEYDEIEKEIEDDMNREFELEEKQKRNRFEQERGNEIAHDLDDMFGCSSDDDDDNEDSANDDAVIKQAMQKKNNSLEDEMNLDEMKEENNEPLGGDSSSDIDSDSSSESDDASPSPSPSEQHEVDRMTLLQLMCEFRLNPARNDEFGALYAFFTEVLGIESASDLVNHAPTQITQPAICRATQTRMLLTKMAKYVTNQVLHNYWSGSEAAQWAELETNKLTYTFKPQRSVKGKKKKKQRREIIKRKSIYFENEASNRVKLGRMDDRIVQSDIALGQEYSVTFTIDEFPQINTKSKADFVINIGVKFYNNSDAAPCETVCISDRCSIRRNDKYVQSLSLSNSRMIESRSQVVVHCNNRVNEPSVTFSHLREYKLYRNNTKTIVLKGFEQKQAESSKSWAKIYIQQAYGNGTYSIQETLPHDIIQQQDTTPTDTDTGSDSDHSDTGDNSNKKQQQTSSIMGKFRRRNSKKKSIKKTRHRASV